MKTIIFKEDSRIAVEDLVTQWEKDHHENSIVTHKVYFFDRIDEDHTVVISYHD